MLISRAGDRARMTAYNAVTAGIARIITARHRSRVSGDLSLKAEENETRIGQYNRLRVLREVDFGVYLDGQDLGDILLPLCAGRLRRG